MQPRPNPEGFPPLFEQGRKRTLLGERMAGVTR